MTETARRKLRKGPSATRHRRGMTPAKIQGQHKVILAPNGISARYAAVAKSRPDEMPSSLAALVAYALGFLYRSGFATSP